MKQKYPDSLVDRTADNAIGESVECVLEAANVIIVLDNK